MNRMIKKTILVLTTLFIINTVKAETNVKPTTETIVRTYGSETATLTLKEFSSLTCLHCAKFHKELYPRLEKEYIKTGKLKIIYRDYPLDNVAMAASLLALKLPKEKYFAFLKYAFANQRELIKSPLPTLIKWANLSGINKKTLEEMLKDGALLKVIVADMKKIDKEVAISGTPLIILGSKRFDGVPTSDEFFKEIEKQLSN